MPALYCYDQWFLVVMEGSKTVWSGIEMSLIRCRSMLSKVLVTIEHSEDEKNVLELSQRVARMIFKYKKIIF